MKSAKNLKHLDASNSKGMTIQFHDLHQAKLFSGIDESEFEKMLLTLDSQLKYYNKSQILIEEGQNINRAALLITGELIAYQNNYWNEKRILHYIHPDNIFCETFACSSTATANYTIEAASPAVVLWFDVQQILNIEDNCAYHAILSKNLMKDIAEKNLSLSEKINHMEQRTTRDKLLSYLSLVAARENSNEFDISMNRQELADYLSVERSAMCNELSKLRRDGYLETKRNHFILHKCIRKK